MVNPWTKCVLTQRYCKCLLSYCQSQRLVGLTPVRAQVNGTIWSPRTRCSWRPSPQTGYGQNLNQINTDGELGCYVLHQLLVVGEWAICSPLHRLKIEGWVSENGAIGALFWQPVSLQQVSTTRQNAISVWPVGSERVSLSWFWLVRVKNWSTKLMNSVK